MAKLDWDKAKKPRAIEYKIEDGKVLSNGRIIFSHHDSLHKRAQMAEKKWLKQLHPKKRKQLTK